MPTPPSRPKRLIADISAHGFGHLAQTACVLNAVHDSDPSIEIVVRTGHSPAVVRKFVTVPHQQAEMYPDKGLVMKGPSHVDITATKAAFITLHDNLDTVVQHEAERLAAFEPGLLLSNIPYTSLLAARMARIPAFAFCSLNWHDILYGYLAGDPRMAPILEEVRRAYGTAGQFILPEPSMPTAWHPAPSHVGPVSRRATDHSRPAGLPAPDEKALALVALGGIASDFDPACLPFLPEIHWVLAGPGKAPHRNDVTPLDDTGLSLLDLMPHADAIITKSGYGTFVEAACHGVRVLFASRPDWPEAAFLEPWLITHATAAAITQEALYSGDFAVPLQTLLEQAPSPPIQATGAAMAARIICDHLSSL